MSRRKQSNPKSFKSDLECEDSNMVVAADEWDAKLADASSTSSHSSKTDGVMHEQEILENDSNTNITALSSYFSEANCVSPISVSASKHSAEDNSDEDTIDHTKTDKINSMKKEFSTPSPPSSPGKNIRSDGDTSFPYRHVGTHFLKNAVDSNHLNALLQGMPLLSTVLPALQRLAPLSPSSISSSSVGGILCVCGVKFSNTSNLEAHKAFYCSHRQGSEDKSKKEGSQSPGQDEADDETTFLKCPHCSYTTTHKLSLNGHMNIHTHQDEQINSKIASVSVKGDNQASDRYCANCDIQFSSFKTFRVHKAHYCQTRHVLKNSKSPGREDATGSSQSLANLTSSLGGSHVAQPVLALPTNPVLLLPYSMVVGAQLLPPQYLQQATFLLPNGQMHPLPSAGSVLTSESTILPPTISPEANNCTFIKTPVMSPSPELSPVHDSHISNDNSSNAKKHPDISSKRKNEEIPLDLTTKRAKLSIKSDLLSDEEKENREINGEMRSKFSIHKAAGEFEGKLLASPQPSPSGETDRKLIKSPRTTHPTLTSPQTKDILSSPKPSTSSRSPNRSSPISSVQESLASLLPGLPLLSEMDSLTMNNLQCLQSLKNMPRELILKLMSPDGIFNGISPVLNTPVLVKQGEAKCSNCNIVFYKEESLLVHKKHYCPGRDGSKVSEDEPKVTETSSGVPESVLRKSPVRESAKIQKESAKVLNSSVQYSCTACGIKFSSIDNLTAHQTFYCLKRDSSVDEAVTKGLWRCPRCKIVMTEPLQAAHQCTSPSPNSSHGWKCPCCPVLSPTATAAQKHLETHAGIKAFRCTICGYRGNTLRGMRTHIRMHFEKRTNDLQEENFIACILEDDEHKNRNGNGIENSKLLESSRILLENPSLSLIMNEGTFPDKTESHLSCSYCPFVTLIRSSFIQHLAIAHNIGQEPKLYQELKSLLVNEQKAASSSQNIERFVDRKTESSPTPDSKSNQSMEVDTRDKSPKLASEPTSPSTSTVANDSQNGFCYCQLCNISFTRLESYMAHKRFYCNRPQSTTPPETAVQ